jgi:predicted kinase
MEDAAFWREQGARFRDRARTVTDNTLTAELLELAAICEEVAESIEDRTPAG